MSKFLTDNRDLLCLINLARNRVNDITFFLCNIDPVLFVWEIAARAEVQTWFIPPPTLVVEGMAKWIESGDFVIDLWTSVRRVVVGFLLGSSVGVIMGV